MSRKQGYALIGTVLTVLGINVFTLMSVSSRVGQYRERVDRNVQTISALTPALKAVELEIPAINTKLETQAHQLDRIESKLDKLAD